MDDGLVSVYRRLLALYPAGFRARFGDDMAQVLGDHLRGRPPGERAAIFARVLADLARTAPAERLAAARPEPVAAVAGGPALRGPVTRDGRTTRSRRDFLRRSLGLAGAGLGASMGGATLAYLWPRLTAGFGALVDVGTPAEVADAVRATGGTWAVPEARSYLVAYDPADDPEGDYADVAGGTGFMALYQRCVHLGCRVPWCVSSTRFECPCHKSRYNRWGEYQDGPAPRGLDRFTVTAVDGRVLVDTRVIVTGPSRMADVLREGPTGASCL